MFKQFICRVIFQFQTVFSTFQYYNITTASLLLIPPHIIHPRLYLGPSLLAVGGGDGAQVQGARPPAGVSLHYKLLHNTIDDEDGCTADGSNQPSGNIRLNINIEYSCDV